MVDVYQPAEDSFLLLRHVEARVYGRVLDMGTGTGIQAIEAAKKANVSKVVAVDIDPSSIERARINARELGLQGKIDFRVGDLFEGLEGQTFDWIVFNPPYLPSEGDLDEPSWSGGKTGGDVISRFLGEAPAHLKADGGILIVLSTQTGLDMIELDELYDIEVLEELPLFFETLTCVCLSPQPILRPRAKPTAKVAPKGM